MQRLIAASLLMILWVASILLTPGCGPSEADAAVATESRTLTFNIVNQSGGEIHDIGLSGANMPMAFRDLDDGESASVKDKKLALPEKLNLHWSDTRGNRKEASALIRSELGPSYSGPVTLTLNRRGKLTLGGG